MMTDYTLLQVKERTLPEPQSFKATGWECVLVVNAAKRNVQSSKVK